ncbi:MAG: class I SAM-dependent methyltransferase [Thermomicrobiales bacterium]
MHENAWLYDLEIGGYSGDLDYWNALVEERGARRVLDLACGTGRITLPIATSLAKSGSDFHVLGLDNSPSMLETARARQLEMPESVRANIDFILGDMVNFALGEAFDVILIGFNSLMYIPQQEDQISCLESVRRHLAPSGCFAFDILTPALDYLLDAQRTPVVRLELERAAPEQGITQFLRFSTERYDAATQLSHSDYFYEIYHADGRQQRFTDRLDWQMIFPREMELLGRVAGLKTISAFGDYDRTPFDRRSRQMLWIMELVEQANSAT